MPTSLDSLSLRRLISTKAGVAAFGVYCLLVEIAANGTPKGTLANSRGPMTLDDLVTKTGTPKAALRSAINTLMQPDIRWLVEVEYDRDSVDCKSTGGRHESIVDRPYNSTSNSYSSGGVQGGNGKASPPAPMESALDAVGRLVGSPLTTGQIAQVQRLADSLGRPHIEGADRDPWTLIDRAAGDAVAKGNLPSSPRHALSLLRVIADRCIRDGCWPGDFVVGDDGKVEALTPDAMHARITRAGRATFGGETVDAAEIGWTRQGLKRGGDLWVPADRLGEVAVG